ncbi:MAG: UdgX family uracil-DNA binding protein [Planctomycetes bacterium]|nr:UdgX family uracil-DNA binding protein [Planctomycetota bacterium]
MSASEYLPSSRSLRTLSRAARDCQGCELYKRATQTVFGAGRAGSQIILVGEQPGDREDLEGLPFVGPAGRLLGEALENAGIDRELVYVTNAVKHFKWEPRGKRRLHKKPSARELAACRPWLEAELEAVRPQVVVCLGATAAQSLLGRNFRITQQRGELVSSDLADCVMATWHPSAVLRAPDKPARDRMRGELVDDLRRVRSVLA